MGCSLTLYCENCGTVGFPAASPLNDGRIDAAKPAEASRQSRHQLDKAKDSSAVDQLFWPRGAIGFELRDLRSQQVLFPVAFTCFNSRRQKVLGKVGGCFHAADWEVAGEAGPPLTMGGALSVFRCNSPKRGALEKGSHIQPYGYGSTLNHKGTRSLVHVFVLPGFHFKDLFLTHGHMKRRQK